MAKFLRIIDTANEYTGKTARWVALGMIFSTTYEVFARYFFNAPTTWAHQTVMMLGGALVCLSWGWVLLHQGHIGLDVIYRRLSPRQQAAINVGGYLLLFFPLIGLLAFVSWEWMIHSWEVGEKWTVSYLKPPMGPSRTVFVIAFILLFFQGLSNFIRTISSLRSPKGDLT
jgi:TRAP-type mannitol/chloroaromatic compound transport system permease small subunit